MQQGQENQSRDRLILDWESTVKTNYDGGQRIRWVLREDVSVTGAAER